MRPIFGKLLAAAVILGACLWVYGPALHGAWIWDDNMYFGGNAYFQMRFGAALRSIWTGGADISYFPLAATARWLEWHFWGERTFGYHVVNVALHGLSALLFWRLLRKLRGQPGEDSAGAGEWLGALIFAVHPVCVESVAWISELKNTLSLPLLLLAAGCYVDFVALRSCTYEVERGDPTALSGVAGRTSAVRSPRSTSGAVLFQSNPLPSYALALFFFLLAMLAKSTVALFPILLLLYTRWKRGRIDRRDWLATAPFFLISLGLGLVTIWFEHHEVLDYQLVTVESWPTRLAGAGLALVFYLGKALFPFAIIPIYPQWRLAPLACGLFLPALAWTAFVVYLWPKRPALFALATFAASLAPLLGLIGLAYLRISRVADHFAYLALLAVVGGAALAFDAWSGRRGRWPWVLGWAGAAAIAVVFAAQARAAAAWYRDESAFWTEILRRNPEAWLAHYDLGTIQMGRGEYPEAIAHYREAARINPKQAEPQANWGAALVMMGRPAEAVPHYEAALRLDPAVARTENSLGMALANSGRMEEAMAHYRRALALEPDLFEAHNNLGRVLAAAGQLDAAIGEYQAAARLRPDRAVIRRNLAEALARAGRIEESLDQYQQALKIEEAERHR